MTMTRAQFTDELTAGFRKIFINKYEMIPSVGLQLFHQEPSTKPYEDDSYIGNLPDASNFTASKKIDYVSAQEGYNTRYEHIEWTIGIQLEYSLWRDSEQGWGYRTLRRLPELAGRSMKITKEKNLASLFNNGASVGMTNANGNGDGLAWFHAAHTYRTGVATNSNLATSSALSLTTLEAARTAMAAQVDDQGNPRSANPKALVVPRLALEKTAREITGSQGDPTNAQNTINIHYGAWDVYPWDFLLTNATTPANSRWFVLDMDLAKEFLLLFQREEVSFDKDTDFDTKVMKWSGYERYSWGFSDPLVAYSGIG